jgi:hypothetical protein
MTFRTLDVEVRVTNGTPFPLLSGEGLSARARSDRSSAKG